MGAAVVYEGPRSADVGQGVSLCYDSFGRRDQATMLLITGIACQLVHWPDDFCRDLASHGFRVIRFDNRDSGRSTHLPGRHYRLGDMADDTLGLLDTLEIDSAHVVGVSLGGMIAQLMAIRWPGRVRSLASLMSTTGAPGVGRTSLRVFRHLIGPRPRTEEQAVARRMRVLATVGSPAFPPDVDEVRRVTELAFRRDPDARGGRRRQHRALRRADDRTADLRKLTLPTVVIHGTADRMCHPSGGQATARAVPGARLELVPGLGHDLPPGARSRLVCAIAGNAIAAEAVAARTA